MKTKFVAKLENNQLIYIYNYQEDISFLEQIVLTGTKNPIKNNNRYLYQFVNNDLGWESYISLDDKDRLINIKEIDNYICLLVKPMVNTSLDYTSKDVFQLRKEKKLNEALRLAIELYNSNSQDEWIQKAYAWVLIDLIKIEINNDLQKANSFFNQLNSITFLSRDEIIDKQIQFIKPKLNINFQEIQYAENLSKKGDYKSSLNSFRTLYKNGKLSLDNLDSYGWAIYRFLKANETDLTKEQIKKLLIEYLSLNNSKPSLLHSIFLQYAVNSSSKNSINTYKFFDNWGINCLRREDKIDQYKEGKKYPSLLKKVIKSFIENNYKFDIKYLVSNIGESDLIIEIIRETFFWKLFNLHKNENFKELWIEFDLYVLNYSDFGASHWHSEILKIANRFMIDDNSWRFFDFFSKWHYKNFRSEDWQEEHNGEHIYKPLALQSITSINEHIKNKNIDSSRSFWIEELYQVAIKNIGQDKWLLRNYAIFLNKLNKKEDGIEIYKDIIFDLSDQAYIWHEFSSLVENKDLDLAISMLCKAIVIQKNEDFLGQIHLDLANLLVKINKLSEAKTELQKYEKLRNEKGWKFSNQFRQLNIVVQDIKENESNKEFYNVHLEKAEDYIYSDIEWTDLILYDNFTTKDGKKKFLFSDFNDIELMLNPFKFDILKNSKINDVFSFKLYYDETNDKYSVFKIDKSNTLKEEMIQNALLDIAIVDHVNEKKQLFHYVVDRNNDGIIKFNQTKIRPKIGDFIEIKYFKTFNKKQSKYKLNILDILETNESKSSLLKESSGEIDINYNNSNKVFGFVNDYYVPSYLIEKYKILDGDEISVKVLFNGEKWNVYDLKK